MRNSANMRHDQFSESIAAALSPPRIRKQTSKHTGARQRPPIMVVLVTTLAVSLTLVGVFVA